MNWLSLINGKIFFIALISVLFIKIVYMEYIDLKQENMITVLQSDKAILQTDLNRLTQVSQEQEKAQSRLLDELDKISLEHKQSEQQKQQLVARLAVHIKQLEQLKEKSAHVKAWSDSPLPVSVAQLLKQSSGSNGNGQ